MSIQRKVGLGCSPVLIAISLTANPQQQAALREGAGRSASPANGIRGITPEKFFEILNAKTCILKRYVKLIMRYLIMV
jgi:hypothetical protein